MERWFSEPIPKRERPLLYSSDVSKWPKPDATCKRCLSIYKCTRQIDMRKKLEAALTRPDIDTLCIEADCLREDEELRDLVRRLLSQDRDWQAELVYLYEVHDIQERLDIVALFKPARYLFLQDFHEYMIPLLHCFPNLVELDLSRADLDSSQFCLLLENEQLAKKISHASLFRHFLLRHSHDNDFVRFPVAAKKHLRSLICNFYWCDLSPEFFLSLIRGVSQLEALKYFKFEHCKTNSGHSEAIETLCAWISSPTCGLSHLHVLHMTFKLSLASTLNLIHALGRNRSLQELSIIHWIRDLNWSTEVLPELAKSSVHHFVIRSLSSRVNPRILRKWMVEMRSTRLISFDHDLTTNDWGDDSDDISAVSNLHIRLKRMWYSSRQPGQPMESPNCRFLTRLPPCHWAQALKLIFDASESNKRYYNHAAGRRASLDMTFYLLQSWLTSISVIPCHRISLKRQRSGA